MKLQQYDCVVDSPLGKIGLIVNNNKLVGVRFLSPRTNLVAPQSYLARLFVAQIKQYFCNPVTKFKLPIYIKGTILQEKIWKAIQKIPCGKTISYGDLARRIGTGPRIIGNACRRNPIPIIIPCHRVVAVKGLGGYCGNIRNALKNKKWLLDHEGSNSSICRDLVHKSA